MTLRVTIHRSVFTREEYRSFGEDTPLIKHYEYLGRFVNTNEEIGFNGCLRQVEATNTHRVFEYKIPIKDPKTMHAFMSSLHLICYYVVDEMYLRRKKGDSDWDDQTLSLTISDTSGEYAFGGSVFEYFSRSLFDLESSELETLSNYVAESMNKLGPCFFVGSETVTIRNRSFHLGSSTGRWITWQRPGYVWDVVTFSSHNVDNFYDQCILFVGLIAMNTWLITKTD